MRAAAEKRVAKQKLNLVGSRTWTGAQIYAECLAQDIYPIFVGGEFLAYRDRQTNKDVTTAMPNLDTPFLLDQFKLAEAKTQAVPEIEKEVVKEKEKTKEFNDQKINVIVKSNPKRKGSEGWASFEVYKTGMKIGEYLDSKGASMDHLKWDIKRGYIAIA